jgi:hypothetical protein
MTDKAKLSLSSICTAVAIVMAITSGLILCACPGWPAIGVGFAATALLLRKGAAPLLPLLALVGGLLMTGAHAWEKFELPGSRANRRHTAGEERARLRDATNPKESATNGSPTNSTAVTNRSQ